MSLVVLNLHEARFDCTYGRGCDGICCRNGRPPVYAAEVERLDAALPRILPELRPEARAVVERSGYLSRRRKAGQRVTRVAGGWCVFFHAGCVLHRMGEAEGDRFRYKPSVCGFFPLNRHAKRGWYVRQKGYLGEIWDLPCLDPGPEAPPAAQTLADEIALVESFAGPNPGRAQCTLTSSGSLQTESETR